MVKFINHKKSRFTYHNFEELKVMLKKSLPNEIYSWIPFNEWPQKKREKFSNYGLRFQLIMAPESIMQAPVLSEEEIAKLFHDHIKSKGLVPSDYFHAQPQDKHGPRSPEARFNITLKSMSRLLTQALNPELPMIERLEFIGKLRRNSLFAESGLSFIMALKPDKMENHYSLDLNISSNEAEIDFSFGDAEISSLYRKLLTVKAALDDDALDLLREAESISINLPD